MYIKYRDSSLVSQHFYINQACQTVLRMDKGVSVSIKKKKLFFSWIFNDFFNAP